MRRRTLYYQPTKVQPKLQERFDTPIKPMIGENLHRHRFETLQHAGRVIGDWTGFYNHHRPHQALGIRTPAEVYALAA